MMQLCDYCHTPTEVDDEGGIGCENTYCLKVQIDGLRAEKALLEDRLENLESEVRNHYYWASDSPGSPGEPRQE